MAACRIVSSWTPKLKSVDVGDCSSSCFRTASVRASGGALVVSVRANAVVGRDESLFGRRVWSIPAAPMHSFLSAGRQDSSTASGGSRMNIVAPASSSSSSSSSGEVQSAATLSTEEQREELKEKLLAKLEAAEGFSDECVSIVNELAKLNPNVGVLERGAAGLRLWVGAFETVKATFKGSGKKGGAKDDVGYRGAPLTLGRLSFNGFKPTDLNVFFADSFNVMYEEPQGGYLLITTFTFDDPRGPDLPSLEGIVFSRGSYEITGSDRQDLVFQSSVMRPRFPERDLEVWKELFAENPTMDEQGQCSATLPGYKGSLDYLYIDEGLRITKGNFGAYVVVRKLPMLKPEFRL